MPSPQQNLQQAIELAFEALRDQTEAQLRWLGSEPVGSAWRLRVLGEAVDVEVPQRRVGTADGRPIRPAWQVLVLHYLGLRRRPEIYEPEVTFADLATARSYAEVYRQRTTARLCATVGRGAASLRAAAETLGGALAPGGDLAYDFRVFPHVWLRVIWHAPDDEFPPAATILLPANIEEFFCAEDVVVLCERLVARLAGQPL